MTLIDYRTETLVEVVYKAIKKDITERALVPGQKLVIRELQERYGISETPIKQALNRLITEGLVENIPRRGMFVKQVTWKEIEELMDIRLMFESFYIPQIMKTFHQNADIRAKMAANLDEHQRMIGNIRDLNEYFRNYYLDQEFHQLFIQCIGNARLAHIYNNLGTHIYAYYVYGRQPREGMIRGVQEHRDIFDALVAGDESRLRECVRIHIENAKKNIFEMMHQNEV